MELLETLRDFGVDESIVCKIWRTFSGCQIYIPKIINEAQKHRDNEICRLNQNGWTASELARRYDLSFQRIYRIIRDGAADGRSYKKHAK